MSKQTHIRNSNILFEQRNNEPYFINEMGKLLYPNINESKQVINESIVLEILSWVKTALTSHRVAELMTSLVKIIYKWLGIDKDLSGNNSNCENLPKEEEVNCGKLLIQKVADTLHKAHEKLMKPIEFLSASLKFKTLKPTKEQKEEAKSLSKTFFNVIILGCLVYYLSKMGIEVSEGHWVMATVYLGGVTIKLTELIKKWEKGIGDINSAVSV